MKPGIQAEKRRRMRGQQVARIDARGRFALPAEIRRAGEAPLAIFPDFRRMAVRLVPEDRLGFSAADLPARLEAEFGLDPRTALFIARRIPALRQPGADGRLIFPAAFRRFLHAYFRISGEVSIAGMGDTATLSDPEMEKSRMEMLRSFPNPNPLDDPGARAERAPRAPEPRDLPALLNRIEMAAHDGEETLCRDVHREILHSAGSDPAALLRLDGRGFERLVAAVLDALGYATVLTPVSGDGGYDILARLETPLGPSVVMVECKRYAPHRPVGVEVVRGLIGTVDHRLAQGVVAITTSTFTSGANALAETRPRLLTLVEFGELVKLLYDAARNAHS